MYRLQLTERARESLEGITRQGDREAVDGALAQLEMNPKDLRFWTSKQDPSGMCIFAGPKKEWKIVFGIIEDARIVYVHSIKHRTSLAFDPRSHED